MKPVCRSCGGDPDDPRTLRIPFGPAYLCTSTFHTGDKSAGFVPTSPHEVERIAARRAARRSVRK